MHQQKDLPQPWSFQPISRGCCHNVTSVMAADDDVFYLESVRQRTSNGFWIKANLKVNDGMLYSSLAGQVAINDHIAEIPEHEQLVVENIKHSGFFGIAIRASNPQNLRSCLLKARYVVFLERFGSHPPRSYFSHAA